jgi:phage terminase small subunit
LDDYSAILANPRHERFALALSKGMRATQAYIEAGNKPCRQNSARLTTKNDIKARLVELQEAVAKESGVTVGSLLAELEDARAKATDLNQLSAVVKAISEKARISGLLVQKVEIGGPGAFTDGMGIDEIASITAREVTEFADGATDADRVQIAKMLKESMGEIFAFIESCKAKHSGQDIVPAQNGTLEVAGSEFRSGGCAPAHVRFGSLADIARRSAHVRFTPPKRTWTLLRRAQRLEFGSAGLTEIAKEVKRPALCHIP